MKKLMLSILVVGLSLGLAGSAFAEMYIAGDIGLTMPRKSGLDGPGVSGVDDPELTVDDGLGLSLAVGSKLGRLFRIEGELAYRANDLSEISYFNSLTGAPETIPVSGEITGMSLMANMYLDWFPEKAVCPYIGLGLGGAKLEGEMNAGGKEDDTVFAYQFIFGVGFNVSEQLAIDLNLRYYGTDNPTFDDIEAEYQTLDLFTGVRVAF